MAPPPAALDAFGAKTVTALTPYQPVGDEQVRRFLEGAALPASWQHMRWMVFLQEHGRARLYRPQFRAAVHDQTSQLILESLAASPQAAFNPIAEFWNNRTTKYK